MVEAPWFKTPPLLFPNRKSLSLISAEKYRNETRFLKISFHYQLAAKSTRNDRTLGNLITAPRNGANWLQVSRSSREYPKIILTVLRLHNYNKDIVCTCEWFYNRYSLNFCDSPYQISKAYVFHYNYDCNYNYTFNIART